MNNTSTINQSKVAAPFLLQKDSSGSATQGHLAMWVWISQVVPYMGSLGPASLLPRGDITGVLWIKTSANLLAFLLAVTAQKSPAWHHSVHITAAFSHSTTQKTWPLILSIPRFSQLDSSSTGIAKSVGNWGAWGLQPHPVFYSVVKTCLDSTIFSHAKVTFTICWVLFLLIILLLLYIVFY